MTSNRTRSTVHLPPLKTRSKEKTNSNTSPTQTNDFSSASTSSLTTLPADYNPQDETPLLHLAENSPVVRFDDNQLSPRTSDTSFNQLSPRSAADFLLQEVVSLIKSTKNEENSNDDKNFFILHPKIKLLDELTECARNQITLILLRDCCVRLIEGKKFIERLKYLSKVERKYSRNSEKNSSLLLDEDELLNLAEKLQIHSKHWFFIEGRLKSCEIINPLSRLIKQQIDCLRRNLEDLILEGLIRVQELLHLLIKSLVLLDAAREFPKGAWIGFVKVCERYNDVSMKFRNSYVEYFSLHKVLRHIAKNCAACGLDLFYNMLTEPVKQRDFNLSCCVEWLGKNSGVYHYESKNGAGEPHGGGLSQNVVIENEVDIVTNLLLCVGNSSNLIAECSGGTSVEGVISNGKEKSVHWEDLSAKNLKPFWMDFYVRALKIEILDRLDLRWFQSSNELGSVVFWSESISFAVIDQAEEFSQNVDAVYAADIFKKAASTLKLQAALSTWDERLSAALPVCLNHRFPQVLTAENVVVTQAGSALSSALEPLLALLSTFQLREDDNPWYLSQTIIVPCLRATLSLVLQWLASSTTRLLATWQLGPYLLITHSDLKNIIDLLKHLSTVNCPSFISSMTPTTPLTVRFHMCQMAEMWEDINKMSSEIQNIASTSIKKFYDKCSEMSSEAFAARMPVGKIWRKKYRSNGPPNTHSEYIDNIIDAVLDPVLEGVKHLSMPVQISIVSMATKAFCECWMLYICKNKIKFSLHGALLFKLDVVHLTSWLRSVPELSVEAQQSIQALDVLRRLHGSSLLLTRQPRSRQRFRKTKVSPMTTIADLNLDATVTVEDLNPDDSVTDEDFVPNKDEWLALRAHGSSSSWHSLWCLSQHRE